MTTILTQGGERAESAGLTFLRARHMKGGRGRFLGSDPWAGSTANSSTLHRYQYTGGAPTYAFDRSGAFSLPELMVTTVIVGVLATSAGCVPHPFPKPVPPGTEGGNIPECAQKLFVKALMAEGRGGGRVIQVLGRIKVVDEDNPPQSVMQAGVISVKKIAGYYTQGSADVKTGQATVYTDSKAMKASPPLWSSPAYLATVGHELIHVDQDLAGEVFPTPLSSDYVQGADDPKEKPACAMADTVETMAMGWVKMGGWTCH